MLKTTALLLLFCFSTSVLIAQYATIKGTVKTTDGKVLSYVSLYLKGTELRTISDKEGVYGITRITPGNYNLIASFTGLKTQEKKVDLVTDDKVTIDFIMEENSQELQTVEVTGRKEVSYKNDKSFSAAKVEMKIKDIPQSISSVTKELIQDRQAIKLNDIIQNVSGVTQFSNYDDVTMRGFRNSGSEGRLVNGLRSINTYGLSPFLVNIERVEFIKGPASAVFANANPGGTINMITKKPLEEARQSIQFSTGSYSTIRALGDFTGPIDNEKKWLYRFNVGFQNANTYRTNIINNAIMIAPSISFLPKPGTRFNADFSYTSYKTQFDRGITLTDQTKNIFELPVGANIGQPTDFLNQQNMSLTLSFSQAITKDVSLNVSYLKSISNEQRNEHGINDYITADSISMSFFDITSQQLGDNVTAYLNYKAQTGHLSHNLLAGYDYISGSYIGYDRNAYGLSTLR